MIWRVQRYSRILLIYHILLWVSVHNVLLKLLSVKYSITLPQNSPLFILHSVYEPVRLMRYHIRQWISFISRIIINGLIWICLQYNVMCKIISYSCWTHPKHYWSNTSVLSFVLTTQFVSHMRCLQQIVIQWLYQTLIRQVVRIDPSNSWKELWIMTL